VIVNLDGCRDTLFVDVNCTPDLDIETVTDTITFAILLGTDEDVCMDISELPGTVANVLEHL